MREAESANRENREVDLWRLMMSAAVVVFHLSQHRMPGGYLAVEFFLMLSGYYIFQYTQAHAEERRISCTIADSLKFTLKKYKKFLWYLPFYIIPFYLTDWLLSGPAEKTLAHFAEQIWNGSCEMLLLMSVGLGSAYNAAHLWYLSCFLFVLPLFYFLTSKCRRGTMAAIALLSVLFGYLVYAVRFGSLIYWEEMYFHLRIGILRAWAGMCLGALIYMLSQSVKSMEIRAGGRIALLVIQYLSGGLALAVMLHTGRTGLDFLALGLLAAASLILLSGKTGFSQKIPGGPVFRWLRKYTMVLYITHYLFFTFADRIGLLHNTLIRYAGAFLWPLAVCILVEFLKRAIVFRSAAPCRQS